jgi:hypothetical protein
LVNFLQFTHYFAFCAVVVLYVYVIQQRSAPPEKYRVYLEVAEKCQSQISSMAENESLAQRYTVVLEELRLEAIKPTQRQSEAQTTNFGITSTLPSSSTDPHAPANSSRPTDLDMHQETAYPLPNDMFSNDAAGTMFGADPNATTPSSLMADLTSWGEFDSLVRTLVKFHLGGLLTYVLQVTAGVGGLDFMFIGDPNRPWDENNGNSSMPLI